MNHLWMFKIAIGIFAIPNLLLGIRGVVTKRPLLVPRRRFVWILAIPLSIPALLLIAFSPFDRLDPVSYVVLIIYSLVSVVMLLVIWKRTEGYSALGVTDESFQEALRSALNRLNLPFEENIFRIRLTSLDAELKASVQFSLGSAELAIKPPAHRSTLNNIVDAMNDYYKTTPCKINRTTSIYFVMSSAIAIIFLVSLI
jgi:hypothetical protein